MKTEKKRELSSLVLKIFEIAVILAVIAVSFLSVSGMKKNTLDNGSERLENSIRKAVMSCYATEGVYPDSLEHLRDQYGLQIDDDRFFVRYTVFAENIMPDITVTERNR